MIATILRTVLTQLALVPIGLVSGIVTARLLGPSDRGLYTLLLLIPATAGVLANVGFDSAGIYLHNRKKVRFEALFGNSLCYAVVAGSLVAIACWFGRVYLIDAFPALTPSLLAVALSMIPLHLLHNALGALLRAKQDFAAYNRRLLFEGILTTVAIFVVLVPFRGGLAAAIAIHPLVLLATCAWMFLDARKYLTQTPRPAFELLGPMWRYGTKTYGNMLANHLHMKADVYLVALYLTNAEIAFYSIGVKLAERVLRLPTVVSTVLFPKLTTVDQPRGAELTARVCRTVLGLSVAVAALIVIAGKYLVVTLYGLEYAPAIWPMYIVICGVVGVGFMRQIANYLKSIDRHQYSIYILTFGAAVNVVLNIVLIPRYRIMGAALSSLITYTVQAAIFAFIFRRLTGVRWARLLVLRTEDVAYVMGTLRKPRRASDQNPQAKIAITQVKG